MEILVNAAMVLAYLIIAWNSAMLISEVFELEKRMHRRRQAREAEKALQAYRQHAVNTMIKIRDAEIRKVIMAIHMQNEKSKPKPQTCPSSCECYHTGKVGTRACLAGHWDERDPKLAPLLLPDTLEPAIPATCAAMKGDQLLEDVLTKARKRGWT